MPDLCRLAPFAIVAPLLVGCVLLEPVPGPTYVSGPTYYSSDGSVASSGSVVYREGSYYRAR
jgi:hypothetical protein